MFRELLPDLRCPTCAGALALQKAEIVDDEIVAGALWCAGCSLAYPIRQGIADLLGPASPSTPAQLVNEWPLTAWAYERLWRPFALTLLSGERFPYRRELPLVAKLAEAGRGGLVVDVACSNGLYARAITRARGAAPGHAVGVDHSLPMLRDAHQRARAAGLRISFVRAKVQALPFPSGAAAAVVIGGSLNEIGDLDGCLAEAGRVLRPDGLFVAMTLTEARTRPGRLLQTLMGQGGVVFWTPHKLLQLFSRHELVTMAQERYGIVLFTKSGKRRRHG